MVKRIHESFTDEEHQALVKHKIYIKKHYRLNHLNWHDYILHLSGVKTLKVNYGRYATKAIIRDKNV